MRFLLLIAMPALLGACANRVYVRVTPISPLRLPPTSGPVEVLLEHRRVTTPHDELALMACSWNDLGVMDADVWVESDGSLLMAAYGATTNPDGTCKEWSGIGFWRSR